MRKSCEDFEGRRLCFTIKTDDAREKSVLSLISDLDHKVAVASSSGSLDHSKASD